MSKSKGKRRPAKAPVENATVTEPTEVVAAPETVETTVETPAPVVAPATSIRKTINTMLADGKSTKEITAVIQTLFPNSQAAAKPTKHIAHYRCLRKRSLKSVKVAAA